MLTISTRRYNGMWHDLSEMQLPVGSAYVRVVKFELGFGAQIQTVTATSLELKVPLFGNYDLVTITGPEVEMAYVLAAAATYGTMRSQHIDELMPFLEPIRRADGGFKPSDVAHFGELLIGMALVPGVALVGIGLEPTAQIMLHGEGEILAAVEMALNDGNVEEAIELLVA